MSALSNQVLLLAVALTISLALNLFLTVLVLQEENSDLPYCIPEYTLMGRLRTLLWGVVGSVVAWFILGLLNELGWRVSIDTLIERFNSFVAGFGT